MYKWLESTFFCMWSEYVCRLSNSNLLVISGRRNHFCYGDVSLTTMMAGLAVRSLTASYMRLEKENREGVGDEGRWAEK